MSNSRCDSWKRDEFVREGRETCEQAETQFRHIVPNNSYYPKWLDVRVSHAEQHRENNNKVITETPIAQKEKKKTGAVAKKGVGKHKEKNTINTSWPPTAPSPNL